MTKKYSCIGAMLALGVALSGNTHAQGYPQQPIRMVVPFGAGGVTDITARVFADGLTRELGQPVVVENRAGAGGGIAAGAVAKARPDGYTLLVVTNGMFSVNQWIYPQLPYDPNKDFTYVAMLAKTPVILAVSANSPYKSLDELVKAAAAGKDKVSFSTAGAGSDSYQLLQLFQQATDTQLLHVPYKSGPESMTALMGGQADMTAISAATAVGPIRSGQVRAFAVASNRRLENLPEVPTVKEVLGKELEGGSLSGIAVPAGTPADIVQRLNAAIAAVAATPLAREKLYTRGSERVDGSQAVFEKVVRSEQERWSVLLRNRKD